MKPQNLLLVVTLILSLLVTACAATTSANDAPEAANEPAKRIVFYNWADYIDPAFYDEFKAETGIEIVEDNFASYEELLAKFQGGH
jgi:spermidine/putrescine transport system substrate-binding protein